MNNILTKIWNMLTAQREQPEKEIEPGGSNEADTHYPLNELAGRIGEPLEVHYLDAGLSQILEARLNSFPTKDAFYLSVEDNDLNIAYWHNVHPDGRISAVRLIRYNGQELYRNDNVPFSYEQAKRYVRGLKYHGPIRVMTREYLSGQFG
jgi:hypothetical protein